MVTRFEAVPATNLTSNLIAWAAIISIAVILVVVLWSGNTGPGSLPSTPQDSTYATSPHGNDALLPLPPTPAVAPEKAALGKRLFFERRLSHDDSISCASCHDLTHGGTDHLPSAIGIGGKHGMVNTPTVFNAAFGFAQFWDGRAANLEEQAVGPIHNPLEMASNWAEVIGKLRQNDAYVSAFQQTYHGITSDAIVDAIASYERTLLTPNSPFDRFLRGDKSALNDREKAGYRLFLDYGCVSCHQGALIGGNMYQRFGIMDDYFKNRASGQGSFADQGRYNVTGREEDRHVFKVPSLRNVAVTAPYFHDGSMATLEGAVVIMARYQLGRELSDSDILAITAFLRTFTGEWEGKPLQ